MGSVDFSRQRVLARGAGRGRPVDRPSREALTAAVVAAARAAVAADLAELLDGIARRHGLAADDELLLHAADDALDDPDAALALLAPDVVVHAPGLMAGAVLTHRLDPHERAGGFLVLDTDLAGFARVPDPHAGGAALHVDDVDGHLAWIGDEDWLTGLPEGALLAVRVDDAGAVAVEALDGPPPVPPGLVERLRGVYDAEVAEPGLPVPAEALLLGLRRRDRAALTGPVPPLDELAAAAGLERRGAEFAHAEQVWATAAEADRHDRLISRLGPGGEGTVALEVLDLLEDPDVEAGGLRRALDLLVAPDVIAAVTEELLGEEEDPAVLVALADRLVAAAGSSPRAAAARWMAAVAAERDARVLDAESHLRAACVEAEGWEFVEDRLAWYEADRGDAAAALGRWRAIGAPDDDPDVAQVRRFAAAAGPEPGRNAPCPCGSGRKYKQCHLGKRDAAPLPERAGWLWRKAVAFLERRGGAAEDALHWSAEVRAGEDGDLDRALADPVTVDVTLHEEGWFARFLAERGPLLPPDEVRLGESWLPVERTVFEVLAVRPDEGLDVRDLRTGDPLAVTERAAAAAVRPGALLCARAVPDGAGHRFVGAILPVPPGRERGLLALLDERSGALVLEWAAARSAPPRPLVLDGPDAVERTARLRVDPAAADVLDEVHQPAGDGWVRLDDDDRVLAALEIEGDVLTVRASSAPLLAEALADLAVDLPEARPLAEDHPLG